MMRSFRTSIINLLGLYLIFSEVYSGFCSDTVGQPPKPSINLQAIRDKQLLLVSWLVNHSGLVGDIYEIQIGRTENRAIIYNRNISFIPVDSNVYTWTWTSDLPLECVDHSVRMRHFYNPSVPSPWSNWMTNNGTQANGRTEIFPKQRMMREGANAMFCCVPPKGVSITSVTLNNNEYPLISIGDRVKAIAVNNLTIPNDLIRRLTLICKDTTGKSSYVWNFISFPPQKPRNLSCVTSDMITVTCTWSAGRKRYPHDRNNQAYILHIQNSVQAPISCDQLLCTFPAVPQLEEYNISLVVKDQLGEETACYSFNISDRVFPVVELDRLSPGVTDVTVFWIIKGNLTQLNLLCQVATDPGSSAELSCNSVSGLCKTKLEHLLPNTYYSIRVRCSVNGKLWGEWTQPKSFATDVLVTLDIWRRINQLSDLNSRQVTLLWTPYAPGSATMVNIQGYIVQWWREDQNWTSKNVTRQTQANIFIGPGQYNVTVQAVLHTGLSIPAHITIPQRDDGENLPVEKRFSSNTTATGFSLSWDKQDTATCGYIVEWCVLGNVEPCTLRWIKVPEGNNTLFLHARDFKEGCRYTFNIYGCTENGYKLLETQTGYSQELKSVLSPSLVEPVQCTSSSVTLEWHYNEDDPSHPAFITGYLVIVQEEESDILPDHTTNLFNVLVEDPRSKSVTIEGLQPNQEYSFFVSALTKEGPGQTASITMRTRTNLDSAHLAKILTPILLLCCSVPLWHQRKLLKSGLTGFFYYPTGMNIKTLELDDFLYETSVWLQSQEVKECSTCDIECLNTRPLNETTLTDPEPLDTLPGSQPSPLVLSLACVSFQEDYCVQSVEDKPAFQQIAYVTNKTYFEAMEDLCETQEVTLSEINEPSESLQESKF
ncbi:leukemia inhibitory factor receptor isoform X3 [Larimichthys crocea]|uniref:leukemia inhibitory factor receptor isoform X3 n=1 Tax=Larimichthys crocea TaxID=215358 RepID=UPI000F5F144C|nr:leukemia inhibitory factor receptor-like isoform X3 [Larimichthys crocea]